MYHTSTLMKRNAQLLHRTCNLDSITGRRATIGTTHPKPNSRFNLPITTSIVTQQPPSLNIGRLGLYSSNRISTNRYISSNSPINGLRCFHSNLYLQLNHHNNWNQSSIVVCRTYMRYTVLCGRSNLLCKANRYMATSSRPTTTSSRWSNWWHRFAIVLRYVRIPVLIVSVYSLGYQQGVIDCTKEPIALQNQILTGILVSTGCTSFDDVHVINEKDVKYHSYKRHDQVAMVGHKIISAARVLIENKLQSAMAEVQAQLPDNVSPEEELLAMSNDPTVQSYYNARIRINGEQIEDSMWQFIFINSPTPNAFVTEVLPRKFFITTAMLQVATTPDELAVVLGHEISHLILGHVSSANKVEMLLRTIEVLLLSMDPTAGLLSVFVIGTIYTIRRLISAAYSRDHEMEADELGLEIAASACYDTIAGSKVMYKMHQVASGMSNLNTAKDHEHPAAIESSSSSTSAIVRLMDTHPPSLDRYERMLRMARDDGENYTKYINCANISRRLLNALWGSKNQHSTNTGASTPTQPTTKSSE